MIDWATEIIDKIGLLGVAFLVALESVVPPIPSELVLLLSGFNVDQGNFTLVGALVAATVGSVVGALILYALGAFVSEFVLWTTLGSVLWNIVWLVIGQILGDQWEKADVWAGTFQLVVLVLLAVVGLALIVRNLRRRKFPR